MKSYRVVVDGELITRPRTPSRMPKTRQLRPLSAETIEAIASYAERHALGSLNRPASELTSVRPHGE